MTKAEWIAKGRSLFGETTDDWKFVCPVCKHVAAVSDWQAAGAPETTVAFSCVGRWIPGSREAFGGEGPGPCNYAGAGLFRLNPVEVVDDGNTHHVFEFAEPQKCKQ